MAWVLNITHFLKFSWKKTKVACICTLMTGITFSSTVVWFVQRHYTFSPKHTNWHLDMYVYVYICICMYMCQVRTSGRAHRSVRSCGRWRPWLPLPRRIKGHLCRQQVGDLQGCWTWLKTPTIDPNTLLLLIGNSWLAKQKPTIETCIKASIPWCA